MMQLVDRSGVYWETALNKKDLGDRLALLDQVTLARARLIDDGIVPTLVAIRSTNAIAVEQSISEMARDSHALMNATTSLQDHQSLQSRIWYEAGKRAAQIAQVISVIVVAGGVGILLLVWVLFRHVHHRSTHDALTGLLNRSEFMRLVQRQLVQLSRGHGVDAIAFIDLDHFKIVNDAGGHAFGDDILKSAAEVIKRCVGGGCALARLGGDEFGLLMPGHSLTTATALGTRICASVGGLVIEVHGQRIRIGASIGLANLDEDWDNAESAVQAVDVASYIAKHEGRGRVHIFAQGDQAIEELRDDMRWVREVENALDESRFELHWQEIRPLHPSQELVRLEILLRLIESDGTRVGPAAFMPAAERFHIASRIDRWVVTQTFKWFSARPEVLAKVGSISINLSGQSVSDPQFLDFMARSIQRATIAADKICLEITETAAIVDFDGAAAFIKTLRDMGVWFALDDFGSGMSSFAYLSRLDVDYIKIDGQFIRGLATDRVDQATVRYIQEVARVTGRRTVAEFVEDAATSRLLRDFGINYEQGFHCHRPENLDGLAARVQCRSRLQPSLPV